MKKIVTISLIALLLCALCSSLVSCAFEIAKAQDTPSGQEEASAASTPSALTSFPDASQSGSYVVTEDGRKTSLRFEYQDVNCDITADADSSVSVSLVSAGLYGSINADNMAKMASVDLDSGSIWTLTADSYVTVISDSDSSLQNIASNGYNIYYDISSSENSWLGGVSVPLPGGGELIPIS